MYCEKAAQHLHLFRPCMKAHLLRNVIHLIDDQYDRILKAYGEGFQKLNSLSLVTGGKDRELFLMVSRKALLCAIELPFSSA